MHVEPLAEPDCKAELAQQKGTFFKAVMQSMARRMAPTRPSDLSAPELLAVPGTLWWLWQTTRIGSTPVRGDDSLRLSDGWSARCSNGHHGVAGGDHRAELPGWRADGFSHPPMFTRRSTGLDFCQQAACADSSVTSVCTTCRSEVDHRG